jgi:hypothetical protein
MLAAVPGNKAAVGQHYNVCSDRAITFQGGCPARGAAAQRRPQERLARPKPAGAPELRSQTPPPPPTRRPGPSPRHRQGRRQVAGQGAQDSALQPRGGRHRQGRQGRGLPLQVRRHAAGPGPGSLAAPAAPGGRAREGRDSEAQGPRRRRLPKGEPCLHAPQRACHAGGFGAGPSRPPRAPSPNPVRARPPKGRCTSLRARTRPSGSWAGSRRMTSCPTWTHSWQTTRPRAAPARTLTSLLMTRSWPRSRPDCAATFWRRGAGAWRLRPAGPPAAGRRRGAGAGCGPVAAGAGRGILGRRRLLLAAGGPTKDCTVAAAR